MATFLKNWIFLSLPKQKARVRDTESWKLGDPCEPLYCVYEEDVT